MKVFIAGLNGNMGRRYAAVLRHLGHEVSGFDIPGFSPTHKIADKVRSGAELSDGVIIATPTETHLDLIEFFAPSDRPILCEKPISKDLKKLVGTLNKMPKYSSTLRMISQYDYLVDDYGGGPTFYDFYRSGPDGIYWDCINIIKHARGSIRLSNDSPIWKCQINGQKINIGLMDHAYIDMMKDWIWATGTTDYDGILEAHHKARDLEKKCTS